ncbi:MAG: carboxypeptidase regulatory-like domain-containing protein [Candidatus Riflebacteria bacterium]|nr:carboxypeptidase regulatory-like domain-containing protein [Candidatus Riflebacteria bacterium]
MGFSNLSGGRYMRDVRVWGGWLLIVLGVTVLMTIGCEKGANGLKTGIVMGRMVDATKRDTGIAGARVQLSSKTALTSGGGVALGQQMVVTTDANGYFYIEGIRPDAMTMSVIHSNYKAYSYPNTGNASGTGNTGDPGTSPSASNQDIWVTSNAVVELGDLPMEPKTSKIPENDIVVKLFLRDTKTRDLIDQLPITPISGELVSVSIDNIQQPLRSAQYLRETGITLTPQESEYNITITIESATAGEPRRFLIKDLVVAGNRNSSIDVYLDPLSYRVTCRFLNCPAYIKGGMVNIYAELNYKDPQGNEARKIIATHTVDTVDIWRNSTLNLPATVDLPEIPLPADLRFNLLGYVDEVVSIPLSAGTQGNIRVDVDFMGNNSAYHLNPANNAVKRIDVGTDNQRIIETRAAYKSDQASVMLFDNRLMRPTVVTWAGPHWYPLKGDDATAKIWVYSNGWDGGNGIVFDYNTGGGTGFVNTEQLVPVGYTFGAALTIHHDPSGTNPDNPGTASGSYTVTKDEVLVAPEESGVPLTYLDYLDRGAGIANAARTFLLVHFTAKNESN